MLKKLRLHITLRAALIKFAVPVIILLAAMPAFSVTLTVESGSGTINDIIQVNITVDDPVGIAGAAFTINYDTDNLVLSNIQSTFFNTFENQWAALEPVPNPYPPSSVMLDSITYIQPVLINLVTGTGSMIAAARCSAETNSINTTLFTLFFQLKSGAPAGTYPIAVISSTLDNTDGGYDPQGETIPMLFGADPSKDISDPDAFPILLDPLAQPAPIGSVITGSITFNLGTDTDGDGLPDDIETGCTSPTDADSDDDGIPDGIEDANHNGVVDTGETDPCNADTDGDGMPDGFEVANGLDPLFDDSLDDFDGDGFCNLREFLSHTNPGNYLDIPGLLCDINADGDVDGSDLAFLISELGRNDCSSSAPCRSDLDLDNDVDDIDLHLFSEDFGRTQ